MKPVRFGVIGSNFITDRFMEAVQNCNHAEVTAIYSRSLEKAKRIAQERKIPYCFDSMEEFSQCREMDAVYIASPNSKHFEQTMFMLMNGKHVLCEKPLASNREEACRMFQCAKAHEVFLMEAMRPVFHPAYQIICEQISQITPIRQATFSYCQYSSRYNNFKQGIVENAFNPVLSNGSIMDIGCYPIHVMTMLFGMPQKIMAMGVQFPGSIDGNGNLLADYREFIANISYSKITNSYLKNEIQGENGAIEFDEIAAPKNICLRRGMDVERITIPQQENDMQYEIEKFTDFVRKPEYPEKYRKYSLDTLQVIDEARKQMKIVFPADLK